MNAQLADRPFITVLVAPKEETSQKPSEPSERPTLHRPSTSGFLLAVSLILAGYTVGLSVRSPSPTVQRIKQPTIVTPPGRTIYRWAGFHRTQP